TNRRERKALDATNHGNERRHWWSVTGGVGRLQTKAVGHARALAEVDIPHISLAALRRAAHRAVLTGPRARNAKSSSHCRLARFAPPPPPYEWSHGSRQPPPSRQPPRSHLLAASGRT